VDVGKEIQEQYRAVQHAFMMDQRAPLTLADFFFSFPVVLVQKVISFFVGGNE
jgi:hypothetical protein